MKDTFNISFDENLPVPKYRQIIDAVQQKIKSGELRKGDRIPSLNRLCKQYGLSQDTVLTAYNELKSKGIITSQVGKGYFVKNGQVDICHKVLLLFDKFTTYKEELYESFTQAMGNKGTEQIFFHHNNLKLFQTILEAAAGEYSEYVIMPVQGKEAAGIITNLPQRKVYILDQGRTQYRLKYPYVCQDFERDIYRVLKDHSALVKKYHRMVLVIRHKKAHYGLIAKGFRDFCKQYPIEAAVVDKIQNFEIKDGDAFVVVDDRDLEYLVRYALANRLVTGSDVGMLSYNEISMKGIIASGITTISTDFSQMGKKMAEMILNRKREKIDNPFILTRRQSF
jgi:DNA-binding transcriptional regulator YhcF (GntR family)